MESHVTAEICEHLAESGFNLLIDRVYGFFLRFNCEACSTPKDVLLDEEAMLQVIRSNLITVCSEVGCERHYFAQAGHAHRFTCFKCNCLYEEENKSLHDHCYTLCTHMAVAGYGLHGLARPRSSSRGLCCNECLDDGLMYELTAEVSDLALFFNPPHESGQCPDCEWFPGSGPHTCVFWCACHTSYYSAAEAEAHAACYAMCPHLSATGFSQTALPYHVGRTLLCADCLEDNASSGTAVLLQVFRQNARYNFCTKCNWFCCEEVNHQCRQWCEFHRVHGDLSHAHCRSCEHCHAAIFGDEQHCFACERCLEYHSKETSCKKCADCGYNHFKKGCEPFHDSFGIKGAVPEVIR